jgi:hypothetical protein
MKTLLLTTILLLSLFTLHAGVAQVQMNQFTTNVAGSPLNIDPGNNNTNRYGGSLSILGNSVQGGVNSVATPGSLAFAMGNHATASGTDSFAINYYALASGYASFAQGATTTASGLESVAMGYRANATNDNTFVWSDGTPFGSGTNKEFDVYASSGITLLGGSLLVSNNVTPGITLNGSIDGDVEFVVKNFAATTNSSTSIYAVANNGTSGVTGSNYVNLGINGSLYAQIVPYFGVGDDAYLFDVGASDGRPSGTAGKNFWIGTYNTNANLYFSVGNKGVAVTCGVNSNGFFGNGGTLTNLPYAKTFTSTNGYFTFTVTTDGSTNVNFVVTNVSGATGSGGGGGGVVTNLIVLAPTLSTNFIVSVGQTNAFEIVATNNVYLDAPTNLIPGWQFTIAIIQDATGNRLLAVNTNNWKFSGGVLPTLSTNANAWDVLSCLVSPNGTNIGSVLTPNLK